MLQGLGDRLGILESSSEQTAQAAAKIQTRIVTLSELTTEIRAEEVRALADLPAELTVPFEKIFDTAGIRPPANGWNVDRLKQLLLTDAFKDKERQAAQKAILSVLNSENVSVEDIVRDAMARDKALDSFETFARKKMEDRMAARERQIAETEAQIKSLQIQADELNEKMKVDQEKWHDWRKQKRARERDLAWTVGYLIDRQVITTDDEE